jgi:hypothetical protein
MKLDSDYIGLIRPSRIPRAPKKIIGWDSEDDSKGTPISFNFYDGEKDYRFTDPAAALQFILSYDPETPALFYSHNLEYELGNLFKSGNFGFVKGMVKSDLLLSVTLFDCKHELRNSMAYFNGTLADMGKSIGLEKLPFDPHDPAYAARDAQIPQVFMSQTQERLLAEFGLPLGVSLGHTSSMILAAFAPKRGWKSYNDPEILNAFYGGRTEVFRLGTHEEPLTVADVNSAYPHAMNSNPYPDCRFLRRSTIKTALHGVGKFTIRVPKGMQYPPLPWRSERGGIYYPTGNISGWWCYAEVRRAVELGCTILREEPGVGTDYSIYPFGGFVSRLYEGKNSLAARKDPFLRAHYKTLLTAGYGKLIQSRANKRYTIDKPEGECQRIGPFWESSEEISKAPPMSNYLWGVHVTAYARLHLMEQMLRVEAAGGKLLYCDTDSIMFTGQAKLNYGPELGQLSRQQYDAAFFRLAKGYVLCRKSRRGYTVKTIAAKGMPKENGLEFLRRGVASTWKPVRLRRGLVLTEGSANAMEKAEGLNVWNQVRRTIRQEYLKRPRVEGDYTRPPHISEIAGIEQKSKQTAPEFTLGGHIDVELDH